MALKFTELQKKIAQSLLSAPATIELLAERTSIPKAELLTEVQFFQQLKLITHNPSTKEYSLKEEIASELRRRKAIEQEDDNAFRIQVIIEIQAVEEELLKKQLEKVLATMEKEPYFRIYAHSSAPIEKVGERYSTFLEVNLSVRDFRALVRLMFFYGPTSVEVIKPKEIKFTMDDFQNGLVDMSEMVHGYAEYIMGILSRQQVEEFNQRLYKSLGNTAALQAEIQKNKASPPAETHSKDHATHG